MSRSLRVILSVLAGVLLAALIAYWDTAPRSDESGNFIGQPFGGDFAGLMDQDGKVLEREAFTGKYQLVFFGFTHCPAICPAELQKIAYVLKNLDTDKRKMLAPIFVSVDPERDTPDVLKSYISVFNQGITGLTGRREAVDRVLNDWKIYSAKVPSADGQDYTMDHSAFLYLRDPQGRLLALFHGDDPPDVVLSGVKAHMGG